MKTLKSIAVAVLIVGMMVMPAFGYVNHSGFSDGPMQTPADIEMIFGVDNLTGLEVTELSDQEMKDTQGAWWPNLISAGWGGVAGGVSYTTATWTSGNEWRLTSFLCSAGGGAVAGLFLNPVAGATIGAAAGGVVTGVGQREVPVVPPPTPRNTPLMPFDNYSPQYAPHYWNHQGATYFNNNNKSGNMSVATF